MVVSSTCQRAILGTLYPKCQWAKPRSGAGCTPRTPATQAGGCLKNRQNGLYPCTPYPTPFKNFLGVQRPPNSVVF